MKSLEPVLHSLSGTTAVSPVLGFNMSFADLYRRNGLLKLDQAFLGFLHEGEPGLRVRLDHARVHSDSLNYKDESSLLIEIASWMDDFISKLFCIETEVHALAFRHHELAPLYSCKRQFVQRRARNKVSEEDVCTVDGIALEEKLTIEFKEPFS
ncbi:MAG: pyridine nucleotide-disulfide oxidoreductase, partial [Betaproteobacteria bacterium]